MLHYDRIDLSKGTDVANSTNSKECIICHYWFFNHGFKLHNSVCNSCQDLTKLCHNTSNIFIIAVKGFAYCCIIHETTKVKAIYLL